jgi:peptidoglycan/LPS O-acetylase OafA/YrhL
MKSTGKLNNIQILRAFAATAVVVFHTGFRLPFLRSFGSFGVDVFFVISGYIMARILDPDNRSSDFFFRRRLLRIVPPYWVFTLVIFLAAMLVPQLMGSTRATIPDLIKSLLFIPFTKGSGLIQPLLFVGWSLNYEMFFYLALSIGLLLYTRLAPASRTSTPGASARINPAWFGAVIVIAVMIGCAPFGAESTAATFYSRDIVLEFVLGVLSYEICSRITADSIRRLRLPALVLCFAGAILLIALQAYLPIWIVAGYPRTVTLGVTSFILITAASLLSQGGWDLNVAWLVLIGDASYILYLIHPYCEYSIDRIFARHHPWLHSNTASGVIVGVSISIVLSLLVHLYAERPTVRFLNRRFGGKRKSVEFASA